MIPIHPADHSPLNQEPVQLKGALAGYCEEVEATIASLKRRISRYPMVARGCHRAELGKRVLAVPF